MPKGNPEGTRRNTSSGGSSGARGSSGSSTGAAARRTAKTIKDINKPMSKASKQLAADATAARNARMANITPKSWSAKPKLSPGRELWTDSSGRVRGGNTSVMNMNPKGRPSAADPNRVTKQIRTTPNPSAPVSKSVAKKNAKALKNLGRLKTGM